MLGAVSEPTGHGKGPSGWPETACCPGPQWQPIVSQPLSLGAPQFILPHHRVFSPLVLGREQTPPLRPLRDRVDRLREHGWAVELGTSICVQPFPILSWVP